MIALIDYGVGNVFSVWRALNYLGLDAKLCRHPGDLKDASRIIIPGVGSFSGCMDAMAQAGFVEAVRELTERRKLPTLGICVGMQAMSRCSWEGGQSQGLGWFDAEVHRIAPNDPELRVPHVGWNQISVQKPSPMLANIPVGADFYFVHSYAMRCDDSADVVATCDYGGEFVAAVQKENIFATQFHPEKSQDFGLTILDNFSSWSP